MSYYHFQVSHIPIGYAGKPEQVQVSGGKIKDSVGVTVYQRPFWEWLKAWQEGSGPVERPICYLKIEDSGRSGDGILFEIFLDDESLPLVETVIPDDSLDTIIESLQAVRRLRKSEPPYPAVK